MALNLRKMVIRNAVVNMTICFVLSIALALFSDAVAFKGANLGWLIVPALGIGLFSGWQTTAKIKTGILKSISHSFSYVPLAREAYAGNDTPGWGTIDDYAIQLETRGFSKLGEYTPPKHFSGVVACFIDASASTLVEVQYIGVPAPSVPGTSSNLNGVHFSIASVVGGNIRVTTTDHTAMAANYLIRGDNDVVACYPDMGLLALLGKHEQLLGVLRQRTGKDLSSGLTMERYILMQRESFRQARRRVENTSGYELAKLVDAFEAKPLTKWAPPASRLAALPDAGLENFDTSPAAQGQPAIMQALTPTGSPSISTVIDNADNPVPDAAVSPAAIPDTLQNSA